MVVSSACSSLSLLLISFEVFGEHVPLTPGSVDDEVNRSLVGFLCATLLVNLQSHDLQILDYCLSEVCEVHQNREKSACLKHLQHL